MSERHAPTPDRVAGTDEAMLGMLERGLSRGRTRAFLRWLLCGGYVEPHPAPVRLYEPPAADRDDIGVCCSGGGIRSASFNLGALQALQQQEVLQRSKYLTAVSGGSYIASAFCMVAKTWRPGPKAEHGDDSDPGLVKESAMPFHPGSPEEQYLRNHLGYLAPDGLARLHLALRMLAGLLVNVLLIGSPVLLLGLLVGWLGRAQYGGLTIDMSTCGEPGQPACHYAASIPHGVVYAVAGLALAALALAVLEVLWRPARDLLRQILETWEVRCLLFAVAGGVLLILVPWLAGLALDFDGVSVHQAALGSVVTAVTSLGALFGAAIGHVRGALKDEKKLVEGAATKLGKYARRVREVLISCVVALAGPLLLVAVCVLGALLGLLTSPRDATDWTDLGPLGEQTPAFSAWLLGSAGLTIATYALVDLTSVSLHPFYRRRLASAFALKRVWIRDDGTEGTAPKDATRQPGGRAEARPRAFDKIVELSDSGIEPGGCPIKTWPMLVVCAAANVSDPGATPPGRSAGSFTFSPTAIGGPLTGAARTRRYENDLGRNRRRDITLPAAVAMSGAALSPSMGKLTYRPMTFLLALANIRLGVWVPNPVHVNEAHAKGAVGTSRASALSPMRLIPWRRAAADRISVRHRPRATYLWKEILGRNRLEDRFLYVTDGGHYENLGLVELLRRGCRTIYCFDAGGGTSSAALVDAIALARSELNVCIEMLPEAAGLVEDSATGRALRACARGRIHYPPEPGGRPVEGTLIYARSVVCADSAWALQSIQDTDKVFPHHSTIDQFFDDQTFEAYRALGADVAERALALERLHAVEPRPRAEAPRANGKPTGRVRRVRANAAEGDVMAYVTQHPGSTVDDLVSALDIADTYGVLGDLVRRGAVVRSGSGRAAVLRPASRR